MTQGDLGKPKSPKGELKGTSAVFIVTAMQFLTVVPDYFLI